MIVRILGEGLFEVPDAEAPEIDKLDAALDAAVESGDAGAFATTLDKLLATVRGSGTALPPERYVRSDLALPAEGTTIDELAALLAGGDYDPDLPPAKVKPSAGS